MTVCICLCHAISPPLIAHACCEDCRVYLDAQSGQEMLFVHYMQRVERERQANATDPAS